MLNGQVEHRSRLFSNRCHFRSSEISEHANLLSLGLRGIKAPQNISAQGGARTHLTVKVNLLIVG